MVLDRFELKDVAIKVVGVGSVGTTCAVVLLMAGESDPLFLQVKEARASVLETLCRKECLFQPRTASCSWVIGSCSRPATFSSAGPREERGRQFYVRQLRDAKIKPIVEILQRRRLWRCSRNFAATPLARSHARSGDAAVISGYPGRVTRLTKRSQTSRPPMPIKPNATTPLSRGQREKEG